MCLDVVIAVAAVGEHLVRLAGPALAGRLLLPLTAEHLGQAPVHHVGLAEGPHHDVCRLEVPVHDALGVGVGHGLADPHEDRDHAPQVPLAALEPGQLEDLAQVVAVDQLHREVHAAGLVDADVVHGHDARVVQLTGDLGLFEEARQTALGHLLGGLAAAGLHAPAQHDLHGQGPAQLGVPDLLDGAHPPAGDLLAMLVAREARILSREAREHPARGAAAALGTPAPRLLRTVAGEGDTGVDALPVVLPQADREGGRGLQALEDGGHPLVLLE